MKKMLMSFATVGALSSSALMLGMMPAPAWAGTPSCASLVGSWGNQLGSTMNIQSVDPVTGAITGTYRSPSGTSGQQFPLVGWTNTYQGLLLPGFVSAFGTFLLRQHFLSLPREVLDAARVDGAGHLRTLFNVVLPMSRPVLATLVLLTAVSRWNDYLWPLIITNSTEMRTLSVGIALLFQKESGTVWGLVMAGTLYVVLPVLVLFLIVQRHIVEGIAAGAVKG